MTQRWRLVAGVCLLMVAGFLGRQFGHRIPELELWIAGQGFIGWIVFVAVAVVLTSLFVPDTVFAVMAGMLYGLWGGTAIITVAVFLAATLDFFLARHWLHGVVRRWMAGQARLSAIERAVQREGFRLLFLIRLTPLSPVAVSYLLGTTPTRFGPFLAACLGLVPGLFVEVYLGHLARHVARVAGAPETHSWVHTGVTVLSLGICLGVLTYISRVARRALAEAESVDRPADGPSMERGGRAT